MNSTNFLQFLIAYCEEGSEAVLQKGYNWFSNTLSPNLQTASEKHSQEQKLLGEAWLITGEVHELLFAPKQAVTCYQIAAHFNPFSADIYQWLALVQEQLGDYLEAMKNIELALKYTEDGAALMEDRQRIQDCMVYDKVADFVETDLVWVCSELLAEGKFEEVMLNIKNSQTTDTELLRCLYQAYGGLNDKANGELTWQQILSIERDAVLEEVDLFYWK